MSILYFNRLKKFCFLFDMVLLNIALLIAHYFIFGTEQPNDSSRLFILVANISWIFVASLNNNYKVFQPLNVNEVVDKLVTTFIYQALVLFGVIYLFKILNVSRGFVVITFCFFSLAVILHRILMAYFVRNSKTRAYLEKRVVVWGSSKIAEGLLRFFDDYPELGYKDYQFIDGSEQTCFHEIIDTSENKPDEIFVCFKEMSIQALDEIILFCKASNINLHVVFDNITRKSAKRNNYNSLPILHLNNDSAVSPKIKVLKRVFDIVFSLSIMILGAPAFCLVYLITKISTPGGAFYKQERIGKDEKPFYIYKFRSMYIDAEKFGPQLSKDNDPRITKWGRIMRKTRLDELPQFWNVLKGDMSVVGYRPERKHYIDQISAFVPEYKDMLNHKPGITSLGQVHYGYAQNVEQMCERLKYDLLYARNIALDVDLGIIFKTVKVMVQAGGK
ncbi:MAG TPA: sugar transferase [Mucilaginibacter sp.]|nr:sugar transferase [Mucilaginibacter sp.]